MPARPWGTLVHRGLARLAPALIAGCSAAPPAPPEPPPSPPPPPAPAPPSRPTPVADPAGASPGVGALVRTGKEAKYKISPNTFQHPVRFGAGVMVLVGFEQDRAIFGRPQCAISTAFPDVCEGYVFVPWSDGARAKDFPKASTEDGLGEPAKLVSAPASWRKFSPGKRGIYASGGTSDMDPKLSVHFVGQDGSITPFLEENPSRFNEAEIVETRSGHLAVLRHAASPREGRPYPSVGALWAGRVVGKAGERKLADPVPLGIGDVWVDGRAADARDARADQQRAAFGEQRLVPVLDGSGALTDEAWLVWFEAVPPKGVEPEPEPRPKKARGSRGKHQCSRPSTTAFWDRYRDLRSGSMDGCGGRMSRRLADATVQKRMHITRIEASGKAGTDRAFPLARDFDAEAIRLDAGAVVGGGLSVNGVTFDEMLRPQGKAAKGPLKLESGQLREGAPALFREGPAAQRVVWATVDPASGESLVVFYEENTSGSSREPLEGPVFARRYSALGEPVGEPVWLSRGVAGLPSNEFVTGYQAPSPPAAAARAGDAWVVLAGDWGYYLVGGERSGSYVPLPASCDGGSICAEKFPIGSVVPSAKGVELVGVSDKRPFVALLDPSKPAPGAPRALDLPAPAEPVALLGGALRREGALAFWREDAGKGVLVEPGSEAPESKPKKRASYEPSPVWLQPVWDDVVVVTREKGKATASWLRAGKSIELDPKVFNGGGESQPLVTSSSPVLPGGRWILPAEPGDLIAAPEPLARALRDCPIALPTGPRRLLLACTEAGSAEQPEIVAGVRVARY